MKRVLTLSSLRLGNNAKEIEHERSLKKLNRDYTERINIVAASLNNCIEEHENNRVETQNRIEEVCNTLREAVNNLEKRLIDDLQQNYTEEEARLQESLYSVKTLCCEDNENMKDEDKSNEEKDKVLMEAESTLCWTQRYKLNHPHFEDASKWVNDTLNTEFNLDISQSLSDEIKERTPRITEVEVSGPNEVHIDLEFLNEYEEAVLKRMKKWGVIEYIVEIWNRKKGVDHKVRSEQILGHSHKAYIEWRHRGGSKCKVRIKAVWTGLFEEEYESVWGEWESFRVPKEHKNSGIFQAGVVWKRREIGEMYVICDKRTNKLLYEGTKPYTILTDFVSGNDILIKGQKGKTKWEETKTTIEVIPQTMENLLEDLKLFYTDKDICTRVIMKITNIIRSKTNIVYFYQFLICFFAVSEETKECFVNLNGLDVLSNIMRNHMRDATLCSFGIYVFGELSSYEVIGKLANELGYIELVRDVIRQHIDNVDTCKNGFKVINNIISWNQKNIKLSGESEYFELIKVAIRQHIDDADLCINGLAAIGTIVYVDTNNQNIVRELGCIEPIRDAIRQHIDDANVCINGLCVFGNITYDNTNNQNLIREFGCIELIKDIIVRHIDVFGAYESGFSAICNIASGNLLNQIKACEVGLADFILEVIENHKDEQDINEWCCRYFANLFSSQETHDKWCTEDVIKKVEECQEKYKDSQIIKKCLICLKRVEDPRVADAVSRGVCTKEITACKREDCQREKINRFCLECATPQKCYQCFDCEGCKACCETCWETKHKGHKGREFFDLITYCE